MTSYLHTINPKIAKQIGEPGSILLNQMDYWISKCGKNIDNLSGKWIYNSYKQWAEQFSYWSISKIRRTIKLLEDLQLIKSVRANSKKWDQTKYYSIDYSTYDKLLREDDLITSFSARRKKMSRKKSKYLPNEINSLEEKIVVKNVKLQKNCHSDQIKKVKNNEINVGKDLHKNTKTYSCSKWTNRSVKNEQMYLTKNNYKKNKHYSSIEKRKIIVERKENNISLPKKEKEIAISMVKIWNQLFRASLNPIKAYAIQKNMKVLSNIFTKYFNNSESKWEEYAMKVNSSQFLMGEKKTRNNFKATFSWLIKESTVEEIMNDEYGVGDRELDMNNIDKNIQQKKSDIVNKMYDKVSEIIEDNVNTKKEITDFKEYVKNSARNLISDKYGIMRVVRHIPYFNLFETEQYKKIRENLFEDYVMKKYTNTTKIDSGKDLNKKLDDLITKETDKYLVIEKLKRKEKLIERWITTKKDLLSKFQELIFI